MSLAVERLLSTRHDASAVQRTTVPGAEIDDNHETPDKRRRDDEVAVVAEMDDDQGDDDDETPTKRLRYDEAVLPTVPPAQNPTATPAQILQQEAVVPTVTPVQIQQQTYWESTEAIRH